MTPAQGEPRRGGAFPSTLNPMPRNHVITIRVSEKTAQAIDAARGTMPRSRWIEALVGEELHRQSITTGDGTIPLAKVAESCPHPRARVIKGFCYRCGSKVL